MTDAAPTTTRQIGGRAVTIHRVRGRAYFRATGLFLHTFGRALGGLLSGAGIRTPAGVLTWSSLWTLASGKLEGGVLATEEGRNAVAELVGAVLTRFEDVDPDRLDALAEALLVGHVQIGEARIDKLEALDALLPGPMDYMRLVVAAIQHNLLPTLPASATSAGSSAEPTSKPLAGMRQRAAERSAPRTRQT